MSIMNSSKKKTPITNGKTPGIISKNPKAKLNSSSNQTVAEKIPGRCWQRLPQRHDKNAQNISLTLQNRRSINGCSISVETVNKRGAKNDCNCPITLIVVFKREMHSTQAAIRTVINCYTNRWRWFSTCFEPWIKSNLNHLESLTNSKIRA